jgi:hypothetical protein
MIAACGATYEFDVPIHGPDLTELRANTVVDAPEGATFALEWPNEAQTTVRFEDGKYVLYHELTVKVRTDTPGVYVVSQATTPIETTRHVVQEEPTPKPDPKPDPDTQARWAVIVDKSVDRPLEVGRCISDPRLARLYAETLRVADPHLVDEHGRQPALLEKAFVAAAQAEYPALVLLDGSGNVLGVSKDLDADEVLRLAPKLPQSVATQKKQLAAEKDVGLQFAEDLPIPMLTLPAGADKELEKAHQESQFPFGLLPEFNEGAQQTEPPEPGILGGIPLVPESEWKELGRKAFIDRLPVTKQLDGTCASAATAKAIEAQRLLQGLPYVEISEIDIYAHIARWGRGSSLRDNLDRVTRYGVASTDVVPRAWPHRTNGDAEADRARHKVLESLRVTPSFEAVGSVLQHGHFVVIGVRWPGGGGHAIVAIDTVRKNNDWAILIRNSWGKDWGSDGCGLLSRNTLRTLPNYGALAIGAVTFSDN